MGTEGITVFVDESGIARRDPFLVVGALKFKNDHGRLVNELGVIRDRSNWRSEAHFVDVNRTTLHLYREVVRAMAQSEGRFRCLVFDTRKLNPERNQQVPWRASSDLLIKTLRRAIWDRELAAVVVDHVTVPPDINYEGHIMYQTNRALRRRAVVSVVRMDSRTCWGLQMVDIMTGAVAHQYRQSLPGGPKPSSPKGQLAAAVCEAYNLTSLVDVESVKVKVYR